MLDLVLVNPNNRVISPLAAIEPPLWAGLIATHYINMGKKVTILDAEAMDWTPEETVEQVDTLQPTMVIIVVMGNNPSVSSTPKMPIAKRLVELLSKYPIALTGLHPSALPYETKLETGATVMKGKVFDGLPPVAWDLLPMDKYRAHNWHCLDGSPRSPYASIYTSLGCPFSCSFCNIHALYSGQHHVWFRKPSEVVDEIGWLVNTYGVRNIKFWDELFALNKTHVEDICIQLIKHRYSLNIWAYARVDTVDALTLDYMKQAGISWLAYGFESGDDSILEGTHKKASRDDATRAVELTHQAGINVGGNFIFGLPNDTLATMEETLEFAQNLNIEWANFYEAKAYPGSELYNQVKGNSNWSSYDQYGIVNSEAGKFRNIAFKAFFSNPRYLSNVKDKFGEQGAEQINEMLKLDKPVTRGTQ